MACCQRLKIKLVSRLRGDAQLYAFAAPQPKSKRGPKPKKGAPLPSLKQVLADPRTIWCQSAVPWYGGPLKQVEYGTGVCLWHTRGQDPVPLRGVLVRYEEKNERTGKITIKAAAFLCSDITDHTITPEQILGWYVSRGNIAVTFEEIRAHRGFETPRHWSVWAMGRTPPCLLGLFSLVVLMAQRLPPHELPLRHSGWYPKPEATFTDVLAAVRAHLWSVRNNTHSLENAPLCLGCALPPAAAPAWR